MFKSATFKLTMWYLAIAMAISLLFSIALYNVTTSELSRGLSDESNSLYSRFPVFDNDPDFGFQDRPYYEDSAHRILVRLFFFNILVLIAAGFSSYFLAKKTLGPIEAAHEQQKRFTADVSHELRTPLTAIKMESEVALLNSNSSSNELKDTISSNLEEVNKLENLINNLLRLTKLEASELVQNFQLVPSEEIINLSVDKVAKQAKARSVKIVSSPSKLSVLVDKDSWSQLLVILLDNAIKYSRKGSKVEISSKKAGSSICFEVKDSGSGIAQKDLEHVFDRFYRAEGSRNKTTAKGFGLGLSIAKMIADIHDATITITSRVDHGTTVKILLPIKDKEQA